MKDLSAFAGKTSVCFLFASIPHRILHGAVFEAASEKSPGLQSKEISHWQEKANFSHRSQLSLLASFFHLANATDGWLLSSSNYPKEIFVRKQLTNSFDLFEDCFTAAADCKKQFTLNRCRVCLRNLWNRPVLAFQARHCCCALPVFACTKNLGQYRPDCFSR